MRLKPTDLRHELVDLDSLRPHPDNPNNNDGKKLGKSVKKHGLFRGVVVSNDGYILAGNHTVAKAIELGDKQGWITRLPFNHREQQAIEIMLIDNESHKDSSYDEGQLAALLERMPSLEGTGFDKEYLDKLIKKIDSPFSPLDSRDVCSMCGARVNK